MKQLTTEQAIAFAESGAWRQMSSAQLALFQLTQDKLCMPFEAFHEAIESALGRPVYTHEFGSRGHGHLLAELNGTAEPPTFDELLALLPAEKVIVI